MPHATRTPADRVLAEVEASAAEIVDFAAALVRVPTVNPPGACYEDCARLIGARLIACGFDVEYVAADGRPEHTPTYPRVNVVGRRQGRSARPLVHVNGHFDVVPAGAGWSVDPFGGTVRDGRLYGRGACDMKAGLAAAVYATEAIRRAGIGLEGTIEVSGTVDEESGGFAGVAYLAEQRRLAAGRTDYVIIPEPFDPDRICVGHRGVYWCEITTEGRIAHGSMPFLGVSAIDHMGLLLERVRRELLPALASRTTALPVVPPEARHATLNVNGIDGGQPVGGIQTPCVADRCRMVLDRRFLAEEGFELAKQEIVDLLERARADVPALRYVLRDLLVVPPTVTRRDSPLVGVLDGAIRAVLGREATLVASPGTYDHKHVQRIAGIDDCVAYGPGLIHLAHQPDEWCGIEDMVDATKVLALSLLRLTGTIA
jgi:succinyl-diaminopimelate desuccinylase